MQGFDNLNEMVSLQLEGKCQLDKEIKETSKLLEKHGGVVWYKEAIHRNEKTAEMETKNP